ncbi:MAG: hypothetical protein COA78_10630 [Blastopirellula sp.]|nr:MAG: hypothetical protein COA78_10630 [Blastopirellula sp.]
MAGQVRKYRVHLSSDERKELEGMARAQNLSVSQVRRARILLLADEDHLDGRRPDWQIAEHVDFSVKQVKRIRTKFVQEGLKPTFKRKQRTDAGIPKKMNGEVEAKLVTLCCSEPPEGRQRWSRVMLADELVRLKIVAYVCPETVRRCLKKIA